MEWDFWDEFFITTVHTLYNTHIIKMRIICRDFSIPMHISKLYTINLVISYFIHWEYSSAGREEILVYQSVVIEME